MLIFVYKMLNTINHFTYLNLNLILNLNLYLNINNVFIIYINYSRK